MKQEVVPYLQIKDLQRATGLSYLTIYNRISKGEIQGAFQMGLKWLISLDDWNKYVRSLKNGQSISD